MNFVGKRVKHSKDGYGTITEFYDKSKRFNVKYDNGIERPYEYPRDFDGPVLSTDDQELKEQIEYDLMISRPNVISYTFNGKQFHGKRDTKSSLAPYSDPLTATCLEHGTSYGETAYKIYQALCKNSSFNWKLENKGKFSQQQHLYAENCTQEGYVVWFLAYSTYAGTKSESRGITNNIESGTNNVLEEWDNDRDDAPTERLGDVNITFIKNKHGQYEFWGVMKVVKVNNTAKPFTILKEFISDKYVPGTQY